MSVKKGSKKNIYYRCFKCFHVNLSKIHLVDKCLIFFMFVLLAQSAYSLFFHSKLSPEITNIDVIVRTSSAAIFGYFISANFIRHSSSNQKNSILINQPKKLEDENKIKSAEIKNHIGFTISDTADSKLETGKIDENTINEELQESVPTTHLQIIIATCIGIFCLITLLVLRNIKGGTIVSSEQEQTIATIAQFRDFVSGCVGFLIGCPTNNTK